MCLMFQLEKTMKKCLHESMKLDEGLLKYRNLIKMTETRLDNRKFRPKSEMVEDRIQKDLIDQMYTLKQSEKNILETVQNNRFVLFCIKCKFATHYTLKSHGLLIITLFYN